MTTSFALFFLKNVILRVPEITYNLLQYIIFVLLEKRSHETTLILSISEENSRTYVIVFGMYRESEPDYMCL